jgi:DNA helicase-2/ATP-dependent DNA helicase PcrA
MADRLAAVIAAGMPPEKTLGVTFTNRAAEHMRAAVAESCGPAAKHCRIQTFHSLCAWILRIEARDLGLPSDFVIYDEQDSIDLMRESLKRGETGERGIYDQLSHLKSDCPDDQLSLATHPALDLRHLSGPVRETIRAYHHHLAERNALDFPDLLYRTRALLALLPEKRAKWSARFQWIQIDEVQDTHLSEYEVIRLLASHATGVAFFGDLDQTIYEWRGSNPDEVVQRIKADLSPVTELSLQDNYRATKSLLRVADRHAATLSPRRTLTHPAPSLPEGSAPEFIRAYDSSSEAQEIAARLEKMMSAGDSGRIGILTRTHSRAVVISEALDNHHIPHVTVKQFDFFRRREIKDLLARLHLLFNPADSGALQRMILRPACGIGPATLQKLWTEGQPCGLRLTDLAQLRSHHDGEPFHSLLHALAHGTVVVFDVETTGLSPALDEVIDIGAVKLIAGRPAGNFEAFLRTTRPLGESSAIHGISEETLQTHGRDPADVFREFARFIEGAVIVGHNVGFDLSMVRAHAARLGIALPIARWDDTLDISRRFLDLERHDLATVCDHFATRNRPSHRALADALATAEILQHLSPQLADGSRARKNLIARHGKLFLPIAEKLAAWRDLSHTLRPPDLCQRIAAESIEIELTAVEQVFGGGEEGTSDNIRRFIDYFQRHDDPAQPPADLLAALTQRAALARDLDFIATDDTNIPILTVHQSKGLEFDTVIIAGMTEGEFPNYYAIQGGKLEEEKRLFYVALTRARKHLIFAGHRVNDWDYSKPPSSFLKNLALIPD